MTTIRNPLFLSSSDTSAIGPGAINTHHVAEASAIKVAVRVRPFLPKEIRDKEVSCITHEPQKNGFAIADPDNTSDKDVGLNRKVESKKFQFDFAYDSSDSKSPYCATQAQIFHDLGKIIVDNAIQGYNCSMFAYGQTGSGKTFTMMGIPSDEGIIPRTCRMLYDQIDAIKRKGPPPGVDRLECKVAVSYLEIYNERVKDLLDPSMTEGDGLRVREHPVMGPYVEGLSQVPCESVKSVMALMQEGGKLRTVAATNMNETSSRSHSIFTVVLTQLKEVGHRGMEDHSASEVISKINLVDLAGSERQEKTHSVGQRLVEASSINKSLHALGKTIAALASADAKGGRPFIPYRDSTLTWLLKESLGGNSKTIMIATVSPAASNYDESLSTLRYADQAKRIVNQAKINEDPVTKLIRDLNNEVQRLKDELSKREGGKNANQEAEVERLREQVAANERLMIEMNMTWDERLKRAKEIAARRQRFIGQSGASVFDDGDGPTCPCLLNLNEDPMISEMLVFLLEKHVTRIGRSGSTSAKNPQDIQLSGKLIEAEHCIITNSLGIGASSSKSDAVPVVILQVCEKARVFVNGKNIAEKLTVTLHEGDRLVLGQNHVFRFNHPQQIRAGIRRPMADEVDWHYAQSELALLSSQHFPSTDAVQRDKAELEKRVMELETKMLRIQEESQQKISESKKTFEQQLDSMEQEFLKEQLSTQARLKALQAAEEKYKRETENIRAEAEQRNAELVKKDRLLQETKNALEVQTIQYEQKLKTMQQNFESEKRKTEDRVKELERSMVEQRNNEEVLRGQMLKLTREKEEDAKSKDNELKEAMAKLKQQRSEYDNKVAKLELDYLESKKKEEAILKESELRIQESSKTLRAEQDKVRTDYEERQRQLDATKLTLQEMETMKEQQKHSYETEMKRLQTQFESQQNETRQKMEASNTNLNKMIVELDAKKSIEQARVREKEEQLSKKSQELEAAKIAFEQQQQQIKIMEAKLIEERHKMEREKEEMLSKQKVILQELSARECELNDRKAELWDVTVQLDSAREEFTGRINKLEKQRLDDAQSAADVRKKLIEENLSLQESKLELNSRSLQFEHQLKNMQEQFQNERDATNSRIADLELTMKAQGLKEVELQKQMEELTRQKESEAAEKDSQLIEAKKLLAAQQEEYRRKVVSLEDDYNKQREEQEKVKMEHEIHLKELDSKLSTAQEKARAEHEAKQIELERTNASLSEVEAQKHAFEQKLKQLEGDFEQEQENARRALEESNNNLNKMIIDLEEKKNAEQSRVAEKEAALSEKNLELLAAKNALQLQEESQQQQMCEMQERVENERKRTEFEKAVLLEELRQKKEAQDSLQQKVMEELHDRERQLKEKDLLLQQSMLELRDRTEQYEQTMRNMQSQYENERKTTEARVAELEHGLSSQKQQQEALRGEISELLKLKEAETSEKDAQLMEAKKLLIDQQNEYNRKVSALEVDFYERQQREEAIKLETEKRLAELDNKLLKAQEKARSEYEAKQYELERTHASLSEIESQRKLFEQKLKQLEGDFEQEQENARRTLEESNNNLNKMIKDLEIKKNVEHERVLEKEEELKKRNDELVAANQAFEKQKSQINGLELKIIAERRQLEAEKEALRTDLQRGMEERVSVLENEMKMQKEQEDLLRQQIEELNRIKTMETKAQDMQLLEAKKLLAEQREEYDRKVAALETDYNKSKLREELIIKDSEVRLIELDSKLSAAQENARAEHDAKQLELERTNASLSEVEAQKRAFEEKLKQLEIEILKEKECAQHKLEESNATLQSIVADLNDKRNIEHARVQLKEAELSKRSAELRSAKEAFEQQQRQIKELEEKLCLERQRMELEKDALRADLLQLHRDTAKLKQIEMSELLWDVTAQLNAERDEFNARLSDLERQRAVERDALNILNEKANRAKILLQENIVKVWRELTIAARGRPLRIQKLVRSIADTWKSLVRHTLLQDVLVSVISKVEEANLIIAECGECLTLEPDLAIYYRDASDIAPESSFLTLKNIRTEVVVHLVNVRTRSAMILTLNEFNYRFNAIMNNSIGSLSSYMHVDESTHAIGKGHVYLRPIVKGVCVTVTAPMFSPFGELVGVAECRLTPLNLDTVYGLNKSSSASLENHDALIGKSLRFQLDIISISSMQRRQRSVFAKFRMLGVDKVYETNVDPTRTPTPKLNFSTTIDVGVVTSKVLNYMADGAASIEMWIAPIDPHRPSTPTITPRQRSASKASIASPVLHIAIDILEQRGNEGMFEPVVIASDGSRDGRFFKLRAGKNRRLVIMITSANESNMVDIEGISAIRIRGVRADVTDVVSDVDCRSLIRVATDYGRGDNDVATLCAFCAEDLDLSLLSKKSRDYVYLNVVVEVLLGGADTPATFEQVLRTKIYTASSKFEDEWMTGTPQDLSLLIRLDRYEDRMSVLFQDHSALSGGGGGGGGGGGSFSGGGGSGGPMIFSPERTPRGRSPASSGRRGQAVNAFKARSLSPSSRSASTPVTPSPRRRSTTMGVIDSTDIETMSSTSDDYSLTQPIPSSNAYHTTLHRVFSSYVVARSGLMTALEMDRVHQWRAVADVIARGKGKT